MLDNFITGVLYNLKPQDHVCVTGMEAVLARPNLNIVHYLTFILYLRTTKHPTVIA